ncbi:MAG: insulinase family protein [Oscillospiraceae bacterium]|nr:insulinase family protein [Oscillospiraceae bacterium]
MQREEIAKGVFYTAFGGSYKKNRLSIHLNIPLCRENLTETALLPFILERGCELFEDITAIKRRLNMLFGSSLYICAGTTDFARVLSFTVEGVKERYLGEERVAEGRLDLLLDVLFHPVVEGDGFREDWVDIEREKLRVLILSEINDKRAYCLKKAGELFYQNDPRALPQNGFSEDLDGIDGKRLLEVYKDLTASATVEIIDVGGDGERVKDKLAAAFSKIRRDIKPIGEKRAMAYSEERSGEVVFDVEQDKYALIMTAGRLFTEREHSVLRLANVILGASPTSRLFMNVREKLSLCYYCASRPGYMSGSYTIDSGVERSNIEKLKTAVLGEIGDMAQGNISEKELAEAQLMLKNTLLSVEDTAEGVSNWYINSLYRLGKAVSPKDEIDIVNSVTAKEIASVMGLFRVSVCMLLRGEES